MKKKFKIDMKKTLATPTCVKWDFVGYSEERERNGAEFPIEQLIMDDDRMKSVGVDKDHESVPPGTGKWFTQTKIHSARLETNEVTGYKEACWTVETTNPWLVEHADEVTGGSIYLTARDASDWYENKDGKVWCRNIDFVSFALLFGVTPGSGASRIRDVLKYSKNTAVRENVILAKSAASLNENEIKKAMWDAGQWVLYNDVPCKIMSITETETAEGDKVATYTLKDAQGKVFDVVLTNPTWDTYKENFKFLDTSTLADYYFNNQSNAAGANESEKDFLDMTKEELESVLDAKFASLKEEIKNEIKKDQSTSEAQPQPSTEEPAPKAEVKNDVEVKEPAKVEVDAPTPEETKATEQVAKALKKANESNANSVTPFTHNNNQDQNEPAEVTNKAEVRKNLFARR